MTQVIEPETAVWTAADLVARFGPIPLHRVRWDPPPGTATEEDVVAIYGREKRLCELVDGVLVEKTLGAYEGYLACVLIRLLGIHVTDNGLGIILGTDGMMRLAPGLVRIPDVSFISLDRLPGGKVPRQAMFGLAPDLAVEVLSKWNTRREMEQKLVDYFAASVREVWYVDPRAEEVRVYEAPDRFTVIGPEQTIADRPVLPGFRLAMRALFAEPGQPSGQ
jgi:Uma2 family endonuclease